MVDEIKQLRLSDMHNTRKSIARIIRYLQTAPETELPRYRLINSYLNTLVQAARVDIEQRLEKLEEIVNDGKSKD